MPLKKQRIRDPVHGLIVLDTSPRDQLAWALIDTPEFQRLRRIKQLGVSDFTFPGATHSRFIHSVGVYHTARKLLELINRELGGKADEQREEIALFAALLHDVGHGALSHTFEHAYNGLRKSRGAIDEKKHEQWTAEIIENQDGGIFRLLEEHRQGLAKEIADLLRAEVPADIYHAVVSSSFDADRLDYLRRDRYMTGTGAGAIDFDWLLDNIRVRNIDFGVPGDEEIVERPSFCLDSKALQAAEIFLLARYHLYEQVYLHKTTRCIEQMVSALLRAVAIAVDSGNTSDTGLPDNHPLVQFFAKEGDTLSNYLQVDDAVVGGGIALMTRAKDGYISQMAIRIRDRNLYKVLDIERTVGDGAENRRRFSRAIDAKFKEVMGRDVLKDDPRLSVYGQIGADDDKAQKRLMILMPSNELREIVEVSPPVKALPERKEFLRYFFDTDEARTTAEELQMGGR